MSIKEKSSWKSIPINIDGKNDLISFEELTEYDVADLVTKTPIALDEKVVFPSATPKPKLSKRKKKKADRAKELEAKRIRLMDKESTNAEAPRNISLGNIKKIEEKRNSKTTVKSTQKLPENNVEILDTDITVHGDDVHSQTNGIDMSAWDGLLIPEEIKRALIKMKFSTPTEIQNKVIKPAIQSKLDIVAAAETGSGKTLAFGIPLLHHMMEDKRRGRDEVVAEQDEFVPDDDEIALDDSEFPPEDHNKSLGKALLSLVLTPTRELAIQVKDHLSKAGRYCGFKIVAIVGGMSVQKQERLLKSKPDIIIATPGRLWYFAEKGHEYLSNLHLIRYLVIDEADRMLEKGHFDELVKILDVINCKQSNKSSKRQTFMFSATLTTVHETPNRMKSKAKVVTKTAKLETLMAKTGIKDKRLVVDLSTKTGTASNLYEAKIICSADEKDLYMYYFIRSHPGRTIVFANSIDCIFHITGVLSALSVNPLHLHAKMQQRQRLKNLERFRDNPDAIMVASDVAARGLDIPNVQHVMHFQIPRTCETYIHRSGRCARTGNEGLSLLLVSPEEISFYNRLCKSMKLADGITKFPCDMSALNSIKKTVTLAKEIDSMGHIKKKARVNNDWFSKAAAEMDIELDDDLLVHDADAEEKEVILQQKRNQLNLLLKRPFNAKHSLGDTLYSGIKPTPKTRHTSAIEEVKKAKGKQR